MYFQPAHFPFGPQKGAFYRGQFVIWPRVLIIMEDLPCELLFERWEDVMSVTKKGKRNETPASSILKVIT